MKIYQIEDTIIAYFDGRLDDSQRAELLHRVSVSPEIRELFTQHETMRRLAARAARNVSVRPAIEEAVFANVAALHAREKRERMIPIWTMRRLSVAAAVLAFLALGAAEWYGLDPITGGFATGVSSKVTTRSPESTTSMSTASSNSVAATNTSLSADDQSAATSHVFATPVNRVNEGLTDTSSSSSEPQVAEAVLSQAAPRETAQAASILQPSVIDHGIPRPELASANGFERFDVGLETSTRADYPAYVITAQPFHDWRIHAGYGLDANDFVGLRIEQTDFAKLSASTVGGFVEYTNSTVFTPAYELYYARRQDLAGGRFAVEASLGAGLYGGGNLLSLETGIRIPIPILDHLTAVASGSLMRVHQNGPTKDELIAQSTQTPVLFEAADVRNTLVFRLRYGFAYKF